MPSVSQSLVGIQDRGIGGERDRRGVYVKGDVDVDRAADGGRWSEGESQSDECDCKGECEAQRGGRAGSLDTAAGRATGWGRRRTERVLRGSVVGVLVWCGVVCWVRCRCTMMRTLADQAVEPEKRHGEWRGCGRRILGKEDAGRRRAREMR